MTTALVLTLLVGPLLALGLDFAAQIRSHLALRLRATSGASRGPATHRATAQRRQVVAVDDESPACEDFTLVVPIYGDIRYLENVAWLSRYGSRVLLATSSAESEVFYAALGEIARLHGFRVHASTTPTGAAGHAGRRSTSGTLRDTIVRDAHEVLTSRYVVCIDADTVTEQSVDLLVGAFDAAGLDLGSVPLSVANTTTVLGRLQRIEYRMAMRLRRIMPWMVCGGCHIARREVHADLMRRHSLFFQGNDVELGLLAVARGYRVAHLDFAVPTVVPDTLAGWLRQRIAWSGGEFRVMLVNLRLALQHPYLYLYGALVTFALAPLRWWGLSRVGWVAVVVLVAYTASVMLLNRSIRDPLLWVYPWYALSYALVLLPLGGLAYAQMALRSHNAGIIRPGRRDGASRARVGAAHLS